MNNEIKLYNYIKENNGSIITNYNDLANALNVSNCSVRNYVQKLLKTKYISKKCQVVNNKKQLILTIIKEI